MVELSLAAVLLFTLIFGVLMFGLLLSNKHAITQSAHEGARRAVPMTYHHSTALTDLRPSVEQQVKDSLSSTSRFCGDTMGTVCNVFLYDCASSPDLPSPATGLNDCIDVKVTVDNSAHPLVPKLPFVSVFAPSSITGEASARLTCDTACQTS